MTWNRSKIGLILLLPLLLFAQPGMGEGRHAKGHEEAQLQLREELGLSDSQTEKLQTFRKEMRQKSMPLKKELHELKQQIMNSYENSAEVQRIAKRTGEVHAELTVLMASHLKEISTVLTNEQMQKLQELKGRRGKHQRRGNSNK